MKRLLPAVLLTCACGDAAPEPPPPPALDMETLRTQVQPMYDRLCSQTACHGDAARPFLIYSRYALRLDSTDFLDAPPLTNAELAENLSSSRARLTGLSQTLDTDLLAKPLRPEAGGVLHGGGDQFFDRGDPSYVLLACWLLGRNDCRI